MGQHRGRLLIMRLLIADDQAGIRQLLRHLLEPDGWLITEAADNFAALAAARRRPPHVVLLDLGLPGPPLPEVIQSLRSLQPSPTIVVITGHQRPDEILWSVAEQIRAVVRKPFDVFELRNLVRSLQPFSSDNC